MKTVPVSYVPLVRSYIHGFIDMATYEMVFVMDDALLEEVRSKVPSSSQYVICQIARDNADALQVVGGQVSYVMFSNGGVSSVIVCADQSERELLLDHFSKVGVKVLRSGGSGYFYPNCYKPEVLTVLDSLNSCSKEFNAGLFELVIAVSGSLAVLSKELAEAERVATSANQSSGHYLKPAPVSELREEVAVIESIFAQFKELRVYQLIQGSKVVEPEVVKEEFVDVVHQD